MEEKSTILQPVIENVSVEGQVNAETKERVFARLCQLLTKNDNEIIIPYEKYDEIDGSEDVKKFVESMPDFFDLELRSNLRACSVVERFLGEDVNNVDDFVGGVVNPALLVGKGLRCTEDDKREAVVFRLVSRH